MATQGDRMKNTKRKRIAPGYVYLAALAGLIVLVVGLVFVIKRYTPTKEHMSLEDYFELTEENESAVIINGEFKKISDTEDYVHAIYLNDATYLQIDFLKKELDDGYVFDSTDGVRRNEYLTAPITIGKNCWIGANTVILRGTTIGDNCLIAAGSVVKGNYADGSVVIQKREEIIKQK